MGVFFLILLYFIVMFEGERLFYLLGWNWCIFWLIYCVGIKLFLYIFGLKGFLFFNKSVYDIDESYCVFDDVGCYVNFL